MRFSVRRWIKHFSIRGEPGRGARRSRCFCKQYYPLLPPKWKSTVWGCHWFGDKPWKIEGSVIVVLWQEGHNAIFPLRWCSTYPVLLVTDVPCQLGESREVASAWCKIGPLFVHERPQDFDNMLSGALHTRELFLCLWVDEIFFEDGLSEIFCLRLLYSWIPRSLNGQPRDPFRHFEESGQWIYRPWISYLRPLYSTFLWARTQVIKTHSDSFAQLWDCGCRKWIMLVFIKKLYTSCRTCFSCYIVQVLHIREWGCMSSALPRRDSLH